MFEQKLGLLIRDAFSLQQVKEDLMSEGKLTDGAFKLKFVTEGQAGDIFFGPKPLVLWILKSILNQAHQLKFKGSISIT